MAAEPIALSVRSILASSTLINSLDADTQLALAESCRMANFKRGEMIWLNGAEVDFFGLVGAGFTKMSRVNSIGHEVALEIMGPGQIFGLLGVVEGSGCPLSASGVTAGVFLKIPKLAFLNIFEKNIPLKDALIRRSAVRMHTNLDLMSRITSGRVEGRIAAILLLLLESYGVAIRDGHVIEVPLTRQEIGELAGTTTESTIRVLSKWQSAGILSTKDGYLVVPDIEAISRIAAK